MKTRSRKSIERASKKLIALKLVNKWSRFYNKAKVKWERASQKWNKKNQRYDGRLVKKTFASKCQNQAARLSHGQKSWSWAEIKRLRIECNERNCENEH